MLTAERGVSSAKKLELGGWMLDADRPGVLASGALIWGVEGEGCRAVLGLGLAAEAEGTRGVDFWGAGPGREAEEVEGCGCSGGGCCSVATRVDVIYEIYMSVGCDEKPAQEVGFLLFISLTKEGRGNKPRCRVANRAELHIVQFKTKTKVETKIVPWPDLRRRRVFSLGPPAAPA